MKYFEAKYHKCLIIISNTNIVFFVEIRYVINIDYQSQMNKILSLVQIAQYHAKPLAKATHQRLLKNLKNFKVNQDFTHLLYLHQFDTKNMPFILEQMSRIGCIADEMCHHPQWTLKKSELEIRLSTHDIGNKVSVKDYILASWIEKVLNQKSLQQQLCETWNIQQLNLNDLI